MNMLKRIALSLVICCGMTAFTSHADSLFRAASANKGQLIALNTRFDVGDIITVMVNETISSSVNATTNTKKESDVNAKAPETTNPFLISEGEGGMNVISKKQLPNWDITAKNELKAKGNTIRNSKLETSISCLVTQVSDSGMLSIDGEKNVRINREDCRLHVSGMIRARDVTPANTIDSSQIANASIELKGRGPLWNNQRRGFVTKILDWFSPF